MVWGCRGAGILGTFWLVGCSSGSFPYEDGADSAGNRPGAADSSSTSAGAGDAEGGSADATTSGVTTLDTTTGGTASDDGETGEITTGAGDSGSESSTGGEGEPSPIPIIPGGPHPPSSTRHTPRPIGTTAAPWGYWEYLPPTYEDNGPFPLVVFLHGLGENGDGNTQLGNVLAHGPPRLIGADQWPGEAPFVVLSPQNSSLLCPTVQDIHDFLAYAIDTYDVAPDRVYLTGLSCGATGAWNYIAEYFDSQVTAAALIAGEGRIAWSRAGCDLGQVPIWSLHGDSDPLVSPLGTTETITSLQGCEPPPDVQMTIFPGVGHDSWTQTYDLSAGHNIYAWMLEH